MSLAGAAARGEARDFVQQQPDGLTNNTHALSGQRAATPDTRSSLPRRDAPSGQLARQRIANRLCALPARVLFEFLCELECRYGDAVIERAQIYASLDPDLLAALGGNKFPVLPLHVAVTE
jgi:hypothetical protein